MSALNDILSQLPSSGTFNLPVLATLTVSGPDAKTFLQGQLTTNLQEITPSQSHLGAYCDIKGRAVGLFRLIQTEQDYQLLMDPEIVEIVTKTLKRYAVFSKVNLDLSTRFSQRIGLLGEESLNSRPFMSELATPGKPDEVISQNGYCQYKLMGRQPRWELLTPVSTAPLSEPFEQNPDLWEAFNILCGLPTLKASTSAQFTVHKLGLIRLNAVSLNKGCYLGQEIVARTQYLGTQKGGLYWAAVETSSSLKPKTEMLDDQQQLLGHVINSTIVNNKFTLILAALKQDPQKKNNFFIDNTHLQFSMFFNQEFL